MRLCHLCKMFFNQAYTPFSLFIGREVNRLPFWVSNADEFLATSCKCRFMRIWASVLWPRCKQNAETLSSPSDQHPFCLQAFNITFSTSQLFKSLQLPRKSPTMAALLQNLTISKDTISRPVRAGQKRSLAASVGSLGCREESPADFVKTFLEDNGEGRNAKQVSFHKPTEEMIAAYKVELIEVFRENDVEKCRELHNAGQSFQCCNRFGESLIHMACRRSWTNLVKFLVLEAGCSLVVQDDYGRTPFHDACWTPEPNFKLVEFLMEQVPELLNVTDVRGHTPFMYVRKAHWTVWRQFLEGRTAMLRPKKVAKVTLTSTE
jgi:hypothetical protein